MSVPKAINSFGVIVKLFGIIEFSVLKLNIEEQLAALEILVTTTEYWPTVDVVNEVFVSPIISLPIKASWFVNHWKV